uniref:DUF72 domain-containing protein n=1 Tax=Fervidicoccus fontis TaxID=683846 RepID=A0A7J3ZLC1_9CREN
MQRKASVYVGTCGFVKSAKILVQLVDAVEVQESFYNLLGEKRLKTLEALSSEGLHLTWKAWQATTHPYTSPTWRKMKQPPPGDRRNYGLLRCTQENLKAAEKTVEQAIGAKAEVVVFQTPSTMPLNEDSKRNAREFFEHVLSIASGKLAVGWEPRGAFAEDVEFLRALAEKEIVIVSDVLRRGWYPFRTPIMYTRLHGLGGKEVNYKYKYTDNDLLSLKSAVESVSREPRVKAVYVLFNNVYMLDDALRFKGILR